MTDLRITHYCIFIFFYVSTECSEVFRVKKPNHSKKIVKQLKKEYKEDLKKGGPITEETKTGERSHQ